MRTYEQIQAYQKEYQKVYRDANRARSAKKKAKVKKTKVKVLIKEVRGYEEELIKSLPNPFGSFEKATYTLQKYSNAEPLYFFTTTCHNTEECIEILKQKCSTKVSFSLGKYYYIFKIQNGRRKLIFRDVV